MAYVIKLLCVCLCVSAVTCQFGFFPQREDRRYSTPFQYGLNLLNPRRITNRLTGLLQVMPENENTNPAYVYPFRSPGISTENQNTNSYPYQNGQNYNQGNYGYQNQYPGYGYNNQGYNPNYGYNQNGGNPVVFPTSPPDGTAVNFVNNNGEYTESNPDINNSGTAVNFVNNNDGQYTESNPSNYYPGQFKDPTGNGNYQNNNGDNEQEGKDNGDINLPTGGAESNTPNASPAEIPNIPPPGIPIASPAEIPNVPPPGIPSSSPAEIPTDPPAGIPNNSPAEIPNVPPPGIPNSPAEIPSVPPAGIPNKPPAEIPNVPPAGIPNALSTKAPASYTELPVLTPVPDSEKRNNFNFGSAGLFKESCETVDQQIGSCISILQCAPYLQLLKESRTNPQAVQVLRKSQCGFEGNYPKVCCPRPGIPDAPPTAPPTTTTTTTAAPPVSNEPPNVNPEDLLGSFPEPPVCGSSNATFSRVVGGIPAKLGDFPWMALLGYKRGVNTRWLCGGSLISSKHVLTAAHCIHGHEIDLYLVRLGELDIEREDDGATPVDVLLKYKIKHEDYNPQAFTNDIGILVMDRDVGFTDLIKPICIPKDSELRARSFENYTPIIAGWGDTEFRGPAASHLQVLQLPVVSNDFCAQAYVNYKNQRIDERVLCAGYKKGGKDACQGDSGGPLMQPIWNNQDYTTHFYQIGVVSFGRKCAEAGFPGVYTRVTHFVPWLEQKILGA
ncbi:uncharacterized protein LOC135081672 isoform X2 [Ostrinia nubilalis]|uniref:uncharacterized protein LOC135081672 isoform X2 n=1 Tax=Ostrinia nubilalis TaxID=29057 RepID=UPI003082653A